MYEEKEKKDDQKAGIGRLPSGQAFIQGWPTSRKAITCDESRAQTLLQAAEWCRRALPIAQEHAYSLSDQGSPLLLADLTLRCTSHFTGLPVCSKQHIAGAVSVLRLDACGRAASIIQANGSTVRFQAAACPNTPQTVSMSRLVFGFLSTLS